MPNADWRFSRSRQRHLLRVTALGLAVLATFLVGFESAWRVLVVLLVWLGIARDGWLEVRCRVDGFSVQGGEWFLWRSGERIPARLQQFHFIGARFAVLTFKVDARGQWRVTILPDMLCGADFRQLRLVLRAVRSPV